MWPSDLPVVLFIGRRVRVGSREYCPQSVGMVSTGPCFDDQCPCTTDHLHSQMSKRWGHENIYIDICINNYNDISIGFKNGIYFISVFLYRYILISIFIAIPIFISILYHYLHQYLY